MKPMMGWVALAGSVAGCAPQSMGAGGETAYADGEIRGRVVEGADSRLSKEDAVALDVVVFWRHDEPGSILYWPMVAASVTGEVPFDFAGALPEGLSDDEMIEIENPETGVADPGAGRVGVAQIYLTRTDAVADYPDRLNGLDRELVLGMVRGATLFYTPIDLDSSAGIRGLRLPDYPPIGAGYHLYFGVEEVDLTTPLEAELGFVES